MGADIAVSLGTTNTRIYMDGVGIVLEEHSVVAVDLSTDSVITVGNKAYEMLGKTPGKMAVIYPLERGVISDFALVESMLGSFLKKISLSKIVMPRAVVCVPGEITEVEKRAVVNAVSAVGIRKVCLIEKVTAAAIGAGLDSESPVGHMVVNVGGGTTDIGIVSLNGLAVSNSIKMAGNEFDDNIIKYVKKKYGLIIGRKTAENTKIQIGCVEKREEELWFRIKGRDLLTGLPKAIEISSSEVMEAIVDTAKVIADAVLKLLENSPPELSGDVYSEGIVFTGGSARLYGFSKFIEKRVGLKVTVPDEPQNCVVIGSGIATKYISQLDKETEKAVNPLTAQY